MNKYLIKFNSYANELFNFVVDRLKSDYDQFKTSEQYDGETFAQATDETFFCMGSDGMDYGLSIVNDFFINRLGDEYDELSDDFDDNNFLSLDRFLWATYIDEKLKAIAIGDNNE